MRVSPAGMLFLATVGSLGCSRTFRAEAVQPNPMANTTETLRSSETITIVTGDMELEAPDAPENNKRADQATVAHNHRYPLFNEASFTIVSRDRLRFHVQLDHKWEDWADLTQWDVLLEDDVGHRWSPEAVEHARTKLMSTFWDREQRTQICSAAGRTETGGCINTVGLVDDGWKHRQTFGTLSVYRGKADFVFYQRDLMHADVHKLRLVVKRSGAAFEFVWKFRDSVAAE